MHKENTKEQEVRETKSQKSEVWTYRHACQLLETIVDKIELLEQLVKRSVGVNNYHYYGPYMENHGATTYNSPVNSDMSSEVANGQKSNEGQASAPVTSHTEIATEEKQLQKDDMEEPGDCFKFMNDFIKQKVETVVNTYYQGSSANLTLIEITFFDHNLLKKRNGHTALIKTLCAWGTIDQLSEKEMKKVMSGMASKMHTLPTNGYMEWDGSIYFNDKKTCQDIGKDLGEDIKYSRKKEKKNDSTFST